jgi:hypothetical protein
VTGTTAFDAKDNLVTLIRGDSTFSQTEVWYGYQGQMENMPRDLVWVGEIEWDDEEPFALGAMKRDETYRILVTFESHWPGDNQQEANHRVRDKMQALETLLRQRNPLNLPNVMSTGIVPQLLGEGQDPEGRGALLVCSVRVQARI